ncbi:MAG: rhodanese-like domain-containing protein [Planctomycetota bacterium]|nr:rhodanese-like domain-containing protein [Planctomycetota bacterium]
MYEEIGPQAAHDLLSRGDGHVYVDVRTVEEFAEGHPAGAKNIPILMRNPATGQMEPNPEFVRVVQAHFAAGAKLVFGCRSGGRSAMACQVMAQHGYKQLWNVAGGFAGKTTPFGQVLVAGWAAQGLPVETDVSEAKSYEALRKAAGS